MKLLLILAAAAVLQVSLTGCKSDGDHPHKDHPSSEHPISSEHPHSEHPTS